MVSLTGSDSHENGISGISQAAFRVHAAIPSGNPSSVSRLRPAQSEVEPVPFWFSLKWRSSVRR
jgi:hypothetical protein